MADVPGYGQSSPVIWGEHIFLTSIAGPTMERCFVHAYRLATGERLWSREFKASQGLENYFRNSRAAPTCVVDAERVYAFFAGGDVVSLTHRGEPVWTRSLVQDYGAFASERGLASSLAQTEDAVIALVDHDGPSYLVALGKDTGEERWRVGRGTRGAAWASPLVADRNGRSMIIVSSAGSVEAYDGETGQRRWRQDGLVGNRIPSAVVVGRDVFVGAAPSSHGAGDPALVRRSNCRLRLTDREGQPSAELVWSADRATSSYSTPLAYQGFVYYITEAGVLYCLDQETGKQWFRARIPDTCWASPLGAAGQVFLFLKNGIVLVIKPGPEYEEVASNRLWDPETEMAARRDPTGAPPPLPPAVATPPRDPMERALRSMDTEDQHRIFSYHDPVVYGAAVVEGALVVRTGQKLYCVIAPRER